MYIIDAWNEGSGTGELQRGKEDVDERGNVGEKKTERSCGNIL